MSKTFKTIIAFGFVAALAACAQPTETIVIDPGETVAAEPVYTGKL